MIIYGPNHGGSPRVRHAFTLDDCVGAAVASSIISASGNRGLSRLRLDGHVGILFAVAHPDWDLSLIALGAPVHPLSDAGRRRIRVLQWV